MISFCTF